MTYADVTEVSTRLGRDLDTQESNMVTTLLADAERMIRRRIPDLAQQITDGTIDVDNVKMVEANAVVRLVRNPNGLVGESDGNYSYQINWTLATGQLRILDSEWALLGVNGAVFVISPKIPRLTLKSINDQIYQGDPVNWWRF